MSIDSLEKRIATLADIEAIRQLKARYCNICDNGYDPDKIIALFTEDGAWGAVNSAPRLATPPSAKFSRV